RLAHDAERLTALELEGNVVDGFDDSVVGFEVSAQVFYFEQIAVSTGHKRVVLQDYRIEQDLHVNPEKSCKSCALILSSSADRARRAGRRQGSSTRRASMPSSRPERSVARERRRCSEFHPPPDCPTKRAAPAHQNRETRGTPPST